MRERETERERETQREREREREREQDSERQSKSERESCSILHTCPQTALKMALSNILHTCPHTATLRDEGLAGDCGVAASSSGGEIFSEFWGPAASNSFLARLGTRSSRLL
jgi:hypothetical protein